jgi:hypothetical protein
LSRGLAADEHVVVKGAETDGSPGVPYPFVGSAATASLRFT